MTVAHDAVTESHTGTTGSASQASFSWTHTPVGTPLGILVFTNANATGATASAVSYGGTAMAAVTGAEAVDTALELANCKAWFLGASIPTGDQTVVVTRTNNGAVMWAACASVTAAGDCSIVGTPALLQEDGTLAEQAVDSGAVIALRYACVNSGLPSVPAAGANSTALVDIDYGSRVVGVVRETTAGIGSRSVGFADGTSDDRAAVHVAITDGATPAAAGSSQAVVIT